MVGTHCRVRNTARPRHSLRKVCNIGFIAVVRTLAENTIAAWDFYAENKDKVKWDLTVMNPPFVCHYLLLQELFSLLPFACRYSGYEILLSGGIMHFVFRSHSLSQPAIHDVSNINSLNESLRQLHDAILLEGKTEEELKPGSSWVDVRDLAEAHVRALRVQEAGGERIIISAGTPFVFLYMFCTNIYVGLAS